MSRQFSLALAIGLTLLSGCATTGTGSATSNAAARESDSAAAADSGIVSAGAPSQAVLQVRGLSCPLCAHNIDSTLRRLPGVTDVQIDLQAGRVTAALLRGKSPSADALRKAVEDSGFSVDAVTLQ